MNPDISRAIRHVLRQSGNGHSIHILDLTAAVKWLLPNQHVNPDLIVEVAEAMMLKDPTVQPFAITME